MICCSQFLYDQMLSVPIAVKDDEDGDLPFNGGSKLQRTISINLKSLLNAKNSPPSSPPASTSPNLSPIGKIDVAPAINSGASTIKGLVDYPDEDSDEDVDSSAGTACKKARLDNT